MDATVSGRTVTGMLWTTGGQASAYTVYVHDTNQGGSTSFPVTPNADGTPTPWSYTYQGAYTGTITAVATLSGNSNVTATAYYALDDSFGTFQLSSSQITSGDHSGASTAAPASDASGVGTPTVAVDNLNNTQYDPLNGEYFVAHNWYASGSPNSEIGITAFKSNGTVDTSFGWIHNSDGTYSANAGTMVIDPFGGGDDRAYDVAVVKSPNTSRTNILVCGKSQDGWIVAAVSTDSDVHHGTGQYGNIAWKDTTLCTTAGSQANTIYVDSTDKDSNQANLEVVIGGVNGVMTGAHMLVAAITPDDSLVSGWTHGNPLTIPYTNSNSAPDYYETANGMVELDDTVQAGEGNILIAGTTDWCGWVGCNPSTFVSGKDFTLVDVNDADGSIKNNGLRVNVGQKRTGNNLSPSFDNAYGVVAFQYNGSGAYYLTMAGQSNYWGSDHLTLEQWELSSDGSTFSFNTSFGQYSGIAEGPAGDAYAMAMPASDAQDTKGEFWVTGTSGGDVITAAFDSYGTGKAGYLDTSFGNAGVLYQDFGSATGGNNSTDAAFSLGFASDGSLIVCGYTQPGGAGNTQLCLAEYILDNQLNIQ